MSFMQPQVTSNQRWIKVETSQGTTFVNVFDTGLDIPGSIALNDEPESLAATIEQLSQFTEGIPESWENIKGYGARLSAPGYLDCTEWSVFDTVEEAQAYLKDTYELDDEEDTEA